MYLQGRGIHQKRIEIIGDGVKIWRLIFKCRYQ